MIIKCDGALFETFRTTRMEDNSYAYECHPFGREDCGFWYIGVDLEDLLILGEDIEEAYEEYPEEFI